MYIYNIILISTFSVFIFVMFLLLRYSIYKLKIPNLFKDLNDYYNTDFSYESSIFNKSVSFSTDIMNVKASLFAKNIFLRSSTEIVISSFKTKSPYEFQITTYSPDKKNFIAIGQGDANKKIYAMSDTITKEELQKAVTPSVLDLFAELIMVADIMKKPFKFQIDVKENCLFFTALGLPESPVDFQMIVKNCQGLAKELCTQEFESSQLNLNSVNTNVTTKLYLNKSLYFLIAFSIFIFILLGSFFYKSRFHYSPKSSFSGTVYNKQHLTNNELYIFIPQKVRVSNKDFVLIKEGDYVEKKTGEKHLIIKDQQEPQDDKKDDFLDLL
ncbi:MAG: hypothetical protein KAI43_11215 [Candidatus Aureabacteria bacterium]|nr:hypothetical protein [Candidatus Auribacterota bacterium]